MSAETHTLANRQSAAIPDTWTDPPTRPYLLAAIRELDNPHPDIGSPRSFPAHVQAAARRVLPDWEAAARPPTHATLVAWVRPLGSSLDFAPTGDDFAAWCAALALAFDDEIPAVLLTRKMQTKAVRAFNKRWPSAGAVWELLAPDARRIIGTRNTLRRIVAMPTEAPRRPMPVPAPAVWPAAGPPAAPVRGPQGPLYTVEEQLAILRGNAAPVCLGRK